MSSSILSSNYIAYVICSVLCFVPAIVFHEVAHGFAAYKLGDPTAKRMGRLSLNPLAHIDIFGTIVLPGLLMLASMPVFGYAKPVPYNPSYFKDPRRGDLIVGFAGPLANLIMACIGAGITWLLNLFAPTYFLNFMIYVYLYKMFLPMFVIINLNFMVFNLIPIPPLDGSSIIAMLIPKNKMYQYYRIQQYAMPIFMIVIIVVPYAFNINPLGMFINATAGNLAQIMLP